VALGEPRYVVGKDPATNTVTLGQVQDLESTGCTASEASWHCEPSTGWVPCTAQIRAHGDALPAQVRGLDGNRLEIRFDTPHRAVATGQAVVCYDGDLVRCGGWIDGVVRAG